MSISRIVMTSVAVALAGCASQRPVVSADPLISEDITGASVTIDDDDLPELGFKHVEITPAQLALLTAHFHHDQDEDGWKAGLWSAGVTIEIHHRDTHDGVVYVDSDLKSWSGGGDAGGDHTVDAGFLTALKAAGRKANAPARVVSYHAAARGDVEYATIGLEEPTLENVVGFRRVDITPNELASLTAHLSHQPGTRSDDPNAGSSGLRITVHRREMSYYEIWVDSNFRIWWGHGEGDAELAVDGRFLPELKRIGRIAKARLESSG